MDQNNIPESISERLGRMRQTVQEFHASQTRNAGRTPYWHHCVGVGKVLKDAIQESGEVKDESLAGDMILAAMGHDLLEDTKITQETIEAEFGERVKDLIHQMTNWEGDHNRAAYVAHMKGAPEEVKLIKLADMIDNCTSVENGLQLLGTDWAHSFFMPIITEMKGQIVLEDFKKYKKTASKLIEKLDFAYKNLETALIVNTHYKQPMIINQQPSGSDDDATQRIMSEMKKGIQDEAERVDKTLLAAKRDKPEWKADFDLDELKKSYSFSTNSVYEDIPLSPTRIRETEVAYYLTYPDIKNMEELGVKLRWLDVHDAG